VNNVFIPQDSIEVLVVTSMEVASTHLEAAIFHEHNLAELYEFLSKENPN